MIILGIDPGIGRMGWGVISSEKGKFTSLDYGCLETSAKLPIPKRLEEVYTTVTTLCERFRIDALSIEELFFNTNVSTAFVVGQARGVIMLAASLKNIPIAIYTPLQVKMALTGYGRADKPQVEHMVKLLLKLEKIPKPDDTADALAIALTHAFSYKMKLVERQ